MKEEKINIEDVPQKPEQKASSGEGQKPLSLSSELNTLEEPISETIVKLIRIKRCR